MVHLGIRCSPETKAALEKLAARDNRKLSDWLRLELEKLVAKRKTLFDKARGRG